MSSDAQDGSMGLHGESWTNDGNPYHCHEQSPGHEYGGFSFQHMAMQPVFDQPSMPPPRPIQPQLQPLVTTPWPSMLTSHSNYNTPTYHSPPTNTPPATTPMSAPPTTPARTYVRERRTLTDEQRRKMCVFAEENPSVKQTEIGSMFGVERSTVSKVLRNRDKYLAQEDSAQNQSKAGRKFPDIEKAVANWAKNEKQHGRSVTDDQIFEQIKHFARTVVNSDHQLKGINGSWLETFKRRNGLISKTRKSSDASESDVISSAEVSHSDITSISPYGKRDAPPQDCAEIEVETRSKKLKSESPPASLQEFANAHRPYASISGTLTAASLSRMGETSSSVDLVNHGAFKGACDVPMGTIATFRSRSRTFPAASGMDAESYAHTKSLVVPPLEYMAEVPGQTFEDITKQEMASESVPFHPDKYMHPPAGMLLSPIEVANTIADDAAQSLDASLSPSLDETRQALAVVWNFFQAQQQDQQLDHYELAAMGSLMNKLKIQPMCRGDVAVSLHHSAERYSLAHSAGD